jgi:hypothetical protein
MPEKGLITVHIRGNSDTVTYVTGSSTRVNLEEGFANLFNGEDNKITATFKLYYCRLELFYIKEYEQSPLHKVFQM